MSDLRIFNADHKVQSSSVLHVLTESKSVCYFHLIVKYAIAELQSCMFKFSTIKYQIKIHVSWSEGSYFIIKFWFQAWNMSGTQKVSGAGSSKFETFVVISTRVVAK